METIFYFNHKTVLRILRYYKKTRSSSFPYYLRRIILVLWCNNCSGYSNVSSVIWFSPKLSRLKKDNKLKVFKAKVEKREPRERFLKPMPPVHTSLQLVEIVADVAQAICFESQTLTHGSFAAPWVNIMYIKVGKGLKWSSMLLMPSKLPNIPSLMAQLDGPANWELLGLKYYMHILKFDFFFSNKLNIHFMQKP